ncbi:isochorismate synthase MenF [Lentilactobacillus raoultii]|uniref:isochorismate synthase n=1 Tax=Lentilactobacillus raoultii TaxID=1987503 RepID=A0ABW3PKJ9_9LACO|nr:isochorismate synthase [Lentilactobacillus raoultii]
MLKQSKIYLLTRELTTRISLGQLLSWFSHHPTSKRFLWETPNQQRQVLAWGVFQSAFQTAPVNFEQGEQLLNRVLARLVKLDQAEERDLKLVGGMSFASEPKLPTHWGSLNDGAVWVPQVVFEKTGQKIRCSVLGWTSKTVNDQLKQILIDLSKETELVAQSADLSHFEESSVSQWEAAVAQAVVTIHQTTLDKVVLGRFAHGEVTEAISEAMWLQLREKQPGSYHILLQSDDVTFLCATPERLLAFTPDRLETMALAGTAKRGRTPEEDYSRQEILRHDPKNLREHAFVVQSLVTLLNANGLRVQYSETPEILQTPSVAHLKTPIKAVGPINGIKLLNQMHPTPALGGVPRDVAVALLTKLESEQRGLFGAPIGLLNGIGDGEFAVGIRSCFLRGNQAEFFAGAGIVADSIPAKEAAETRAKFSAILSIFNKENG